jgi:hypothetical protein
MRSRPPLRNVMPVTVGLPPFRSLSSSIQTFGKNLRYFRALPGRNAEKPDPGNRTASAPLAPKVGAVFFARH